MGSRATVLPGTFLKVTLGATSKVLGAGNWTSSGATRKTIESSEFGDEIDVFVFGTADGGSVTLTDVNYDPTDAQQQSFVDACEDGVELDNGVTSGPRFWINSTSYFSIGTSGKLLMTKAGGVKAQRNGLCKTDFEMRVSGAFMYLT